MFPNFFLQLSGTTDVRSIVQHSIMKVWANDLEIGRWVLARSRTLIQIASPDRRNWDWHDKRTVWPGCVSDIERRGVSDDCHWYLISDITLAPNTVRSSIKSGPALPSFAALHESGLDHTDLTTICHPPEDSKPCYGCLLVGTRLHCSTSLQAFLAFCL